jgi:hypothetical protein
MGSDPFDEQLAAASRGLVVSPVASGVASDAAKLDGDSRSRTSFVPFLAAVGAIALVAIVALRSSPDRNGSAGGPDTSPLTSGSDLQSSPAPSGSASAQIDIEGALLVAGLLDNRLTLSEASPQGSPDIVGQVELDMAAFRIVQAVCPATNVIGRHVVLFGYVPGGHNASGSVRVDGLDPGRMATGDDGTFIYVTDEPPSPLLSWTATAAGFPPIESSVAVYGTRLIRSSPGTSVSSNKCVVFDPAVKKRP